MTNNPSTRTIAASIAGSQGSVQPDEKEDRTNLLSQTHELEAHIEALRELDKVRRRSAKLRQEGLEALEELVTKAVPRNKNPFKTSDDMLGMLPLYEYFGSYQKSATIPIHHGYKS